VNFFFDFKYAVRLLMRSPGFLVLTVTAMAAGLGLSFYMLAFLDHIWLRPLPLENGENMVTIVPTFNGKISGGGVSTHEFHALKDGTTSFSMMGAYNFDVAILSTGDRAVRHSMSWIEPMFFEYVGVDPIIGRVLAPEDDVPGALPVAVIGYDLWQNYFNGTDEIIGQEFKINGEVAEVVGVMPEFFVFPPGAELWMAMRADEEAVPWGQGLITVNIFAMLEPDVAMEMADEDVKAVMRRAEQEHPEMNSGVSARVTTFKKRFLGDGIDQIFVTMQVAAFFVLALACINVENLLLARGNERGKETAIRIALGAPKVRLIMQMMWESVIVSFLGGAIAVLLAAWGLEITFGILSTLIDIEPPFWWRATMDAPVLGIAFVVTLATAFVTGIVPAWKMSSGDFNAVLRDGTRGAQGKRAGHVGRILVVSEVGLSTALLILSGVLSVLIAQAIRTDYGARIDGVMTARVVLPEGSHPEEQDRLRYYEQLSSELSRMPGVDAAGISLALPGNGAGSGSYPFEVEGYEIVDNNYPRAGFSAAGLDFFRAFDIRILEGRAFDARDTADGMKTAVISDSLAERYWPDGDAVGGRLRWFDESEISGWVTVIGVVPHIIHGQPFDDVKVNPTIYVPLTQYPAEMMTLFATTDVDPDSLRQPMLDAAARVDAEVPIFSMRSLRDQLTRNMAGIVFIKDLFVIFSLCALLLASTGIYGVMANSIVQRTQEIGMRRALGATDERVMSLLMRQSWFQLGVGVILGAPIAYLMSQAFVELIGPETRDHNWVFLLMPLLITGVVSVATFVPARRAIRLEPSAALHYE
jgi:predicted permease